jgi:hypothetical protein
LGGIFNAFPYTGNTLVEFEIRIDDLLDGRLNLVIEGEAYIFARVGSRGGIERRIAVQPLHHLPAVVDNTDVRPGKIIRGGVTTCGRDGCHYVPKNCYAITRRHAECRGHCHGGKIICP